MVKKANKKKASGANPAGDNTVGPILPKTELAKSGADPSPPVKPETPKEEGLLQKAGELLEKGEIKVLNDAKNSVTGGIDSLVSLAGGGAAAEVIGAIGKGAVEVLFPTNVIDLIPGGKAISGGKKAAKLAEKLGKEAAEKATKETTEKAVKEAAEKESKEAAEQATKDGTKKADVSGNKGGHGKGKAKMKCGEGGKYADLKKKTGEGKFDRDHIPSKAALLEKAKVLNNGTKLTPDQVKKIANLGNSIAIPRKAHQQVSPTYGGRNTPKADAHGEGGLAGAAKRDVDTMLGEIDKYDPDCKDAYKEASKKILDMTNDDYDRELKKLLD